MSKNEINGILAPPISRGGITELSTEEPDSGLSQRKSEQSARKPCLLLIIWSISAALAVGVGFRDQTYFQQRTPADRRMLAREIRSELAKMTH